ncbi:Glutathione S-transferase [Ectocarpus siliculosus]|uniref:Glutathione S-transferase n=1 Tax=Ectocarpus siliculosus TaxID=2880 RepID=D8LK37_ECTSI|nr:Glutathione S-transferase [Ectocarpus siliculosus]|eukprot:CBN74506.1 Glutathione S-transferase [Ectocarpus siliculosus]
MAPMKLTYFDIAALGEQLRLALAQSGVEWIDNRVTFEEWPTLKPTLPYQQMPVLEVDGAVIPQTFAILRYVGKMGDLYPTDPIQAAFADSATDAVNDMHGHMRAIFFEKDADAKTQLLKDLVEKLLPPWLANLEKALKLAGGKYFAGDKLSIGDIAVVARLNWLTDGTFDESVPSAILEEFPLLSSLVQRVMAEPRIVAYMEERPKK